MFDGTNWVADAISLGILVNLSTRSRPIRTLRLFAACMAAETNTFSPIPTGLRTFRERVFLGPGEHPDEQPLVATAPLWVARKRAHKEQFDLVEGSCFSANPGGLTNRSAYEWMRDQILSELRAAMPVDGILLGLHGAMVADGYDDVEADILAQVRSIAGPGVTVGVELDPHCHLTVKRVELADLIILYKEFPHTDVVDRAHDLLNLLLATIRGEIKPVMSVYDCRQIGSYPTNLPFMRGFVDRMIACEGKDDILSVSFAHGFPYADVEELGSRVLVIADHNKSRADELAERLGREIVSERGKTTPIYATVEQGLDLALSYPEFPVVIADPADNAGGGAGSDNTTILHALIAKGANDVALGPIWDPVAVDLCFNAELGGRFALRVGGKLSPSSGQPVDAQVQVVGLARNCVQSFGPVQVATGDCAAIRVGGIEVVLTSIRVQAFGLDLFTNVGIDPALRKLVVVKSTNHFFAAFGPIAKKVVYVESDGPIRADYTAVPYTKVRRPIWPLDERVHPGLVY